MFNFEKISLGLSSLFKNHLNGQAKQGQVTPNNTFIPSTAVERPEGHINPRYGIRDNLKVFPLGEYFKQ